MDRKTEIRALLKLSPEEVINRAGERLIVCEDIDALHAHFAENIAREISNNNAEGQPTRLILPVGPTGQYPVLAEKINRQKISLSNCWLFFMDEYCDDAGRAITKDHPLSFGAEAQRLFFDRLNDGHGLKAEQVIFPDENNIDHLEDMIEQAGGIDVCFGGIGIHGHVAFNEPAPGIDHSGPRRVSLNDFTVTINAVRAQVGGNLECFPRQAYTLGMRQILDSRKIRLYCRNGCELDWANTILRMALFGTPGCDYPVTYIRNSDYVITTDCDTLASARYDI